MDPQPHAPDAPPPSQSNDLPEAHDPTTEKIHSLSNFHVSEAIGLPLLTKDVGAKTEPTERKSSNAGSTLGALGAGGNMFSYYSAQDRLMAAAAAAVILGPLLFGALRG